jgi:hypothetical protein
MSRIFPNKQQNLYENISTTNREYVIKFCLTNRDKSNPGFAFTLLTKVKER